ncbi:hypothetical protein DTO166G4_593 [Paecilomyces variotii]|nr:hypothetical protein DTO164E3_7822 [Paecilomyces variotii]KAJ9217789.1 hypothetical protein DTO166G4_593 [Paecilomyces variotii]KAJ9219347.1 hypothetical protein DTO169C6_8319 [Paecilomyces variotii]KAJ9228019.1 hypothetical protein DTO166G5_8911 [Paecilomyces variotii]KAJ9234572.1 hypothetical protein DTO169E5_6523 [Paecilomyces variotii]
MSLTGFQEESPDVQSASGPGILVHRYMPAVGKELKGTSDAEYPVLVDNSEDAKAVPSGIKRVLNAGHGTVQIDELDWNKLPTLHHIISRLAEIPVYEVVEAKVVEGEGVPDVSSARRIQHL